MVERASDVTGFLKASSLGMRAGVVHGSHKIQSLKTRSPVTRAQDITLGDLIFQVLVGRKEIRKSLHVSSLLGSSGPCGLNSRVENRTGLEPGLGKQP